MNSLAFLWLTVGIPHHQPLNFAFAERSLTNPSASQTQKIVVPKHKRKVEVKPAGIAILVPKQWRTYSDNGGYQISFRVPTGKPKIEGRYDIGFVLDESSDVEQFQIAVKKTAEARGDQNIEQYQSEVMGGQFAFTKFVRENRTTLRGVLFRSTKQKLVTVLNAPSEDFEVVEAEFRKTLESLAEIKVVEAKLPTVPVEKKIALTANYTPSKIPVPVKVKVNVRGLDYVLRIPENSTVTKLSDNSYSMSRKDLIGSIVINLTPYEVGKDDPIVILFRRMSENMKLFKGGIRRVDRDERFADGSYRHFVTRSGNDASTSRPLTVLECLYLNSEVPIVMDVYSPINDPKLVRSAEEKFDLYSRALRLERTNN